MAQEQRPIPPRVLAAFEVLRGRLKPGASEAVDLDWARKIVARRERGETVSQAAYDMARDALEGRGLR